MDTISQRIQELVAHTKDLPTIPEAALRLVRQASEENVSAITIVKGLSADQSLSARVLRLANSAFYGLPRQVTTLHDSVVVLGIRTVRHLALLASTFPWLSRWLPGYNLTPRALWKHSFGTALISEMISKRTRIAEPDEALSAGLLHDLGKIVLSAWLEEELAVVMSLMNETGIPLYEAEKNVIGFTHADVGGFLVKDWNLPENFVSAIENHHQPDKAKSAVGLTCVIHLADIICGHLETGAEPEVILSELPEIVISTLNVDDTELEIINDQAMSMLNDASSMMECDMAA